MTKWLPGLLIFILAGASITLTQSDVTIHQFDSPVDALSIALERGQTVDVSARTDDGWSEWETLTIDDEQDPLSRESNLAIFPQSTHVIRIRGVFEESALHPISVTKEPASTKVAQMVAARTPHILSRNEWGADDSFLYRNGEPPPPDEEKDSNGTEPAPATSARVRDCEEAQFNHPNEFKAARTVTQKDGKHLRWAQQYSPSVKLLAVHHTAIKVDGDARPGVERMRALYQYHAQNRGWGDIGYHYVIDEEGEIYEGRAGGDYVIGGHAYCNNIGTIGVSLMGNFEVEKPTQVQVQSLQWLLDLLGKQYNVEPGRSILFHGETTPTIVGHGDLVATSCPGYYVRETLGQIRGNVQNGNLSATIRFPISRTPDESKAEQRRQERLQSKPQVREGLFADGVTDLVGRPGGEVIIRMRYTAGKAMQRGSRVGKIIRSHPRIGVWQQRGDSYIRLRGDVTLSQFVKAGESTVVQLKVQLPRDASTSTLKVGDVTYNLRAEGRRARTPTGEPSYQSSSSVPISRSSSLRSSHSSRASSVNTANNTPIRIRLTRTEANLTGCSDPAIESLRPKYRGTIECMNIEGKPAIINTVSVEDYLIGLAEEPDTEPYEKQRAFAIAARTYAAHYMQAEYRKFPGMPYDGSDSPATFQLYGGIAFEQQNPRWVEAVRDTVNKVLKKNGQIIRPPYFSSDDGRTRTPSEAGWGNSFPFAEIFTSKPDPWCEGQAMRGHGVGMSGCGSEGQANEGKSAEQILEYYYPGTTITSR